MNYNKLLDRVACRAGLTSVDEAEVATKAVLHVLGECLARSHAEQLADQLPEELAGAVRGAVHGRDLDLAAWVSHVAQRIGPAVSSSVALELSASVAMSLAEAIPESLGELLRRDLPAPISHLLRPPPELSSPSRLHVAHRHHTLAEGAPGGTRPLYSARPQLAQSESVALAQNPHGDTKLSSAHGLTQEREAESIAVARGLTQERERRSLATADDEPLMVAGK